MDGSKPLPSFDEDYLLWAKAQAAALRARDWNAVDAFGLFEPKTDYETRLPQACPYTAIDVIGDQP